MNAGAVPSYPLTYGRHLLYIELGATAKPIDCADHALALGAVVQQTLAAVRRAFEHTDDLETFELALEGCELLAGLQHALALRAHERLPLAGPTEKLP